MSIHVYIYILIYTYNFVRLHITSIIGIFYAPPGLLRLDEDDMCLPGMACGLCKTRMLDRAAASQPLLPGSNRILCGVFAVFTISNFGWPGGLAVSGRSVFGGLSQNGVCQRVLRFVLFWNMYIFSDSQN